jgi:signal transduction histidine kinase
LLTNTDFAQEESPDAAAADDSLGRILQAEPQFLAGMDRIVFQYNREAHDRVARLRLIERLLLAVTLLVLAAEGWFVFRPAVARLRTIGSRLHAATDELVRAQRAAEAASEAKSQFLANVSHELRTPLHAILAATELAESKCASSVQADQLATITDAGSSLLGLVNDLLDMAKIEAGKLELLPSPTDLAALARRVILLFEVSAGQKGLALSCQIDPRLPRPRIRLISRGTLAITWATKFTSACSLGRTRSILMSVQRRLSRIQARWQGSGIASRYLRITWRHCSKVRIQARSAGTATSRRLWSILATASPPWGSPPPFNWWARIRRVSH